MPANAQAIIGEIMQTIHDAKDTTTSSIDSSSLASNTDSDSSDNSDSSDDSSDNIYTVHSTVADPAIAKKCQKGQELLAEQTLLDEETKNIIYSVLALLASTVILFHRYLPMWCKSLDFMFAKAHFIEDEKAMRSLGKFLLFCWCWGKQRHTCFCSFVTTHHTHQLFPHRSFKIPDWALPSMWLYFS